MSGIEETAASALFTFKFGTTHNEMSESFDNVGRILTVILESKLNENFYGILYRLKPITDIDHYMLKFNFDREVALRQNEDLSLVVKFWLEDSNELRAESESALESVVKVEEFIKFLEKQELDNNSLTIKTLHFIKNKDNTQTIDLQASDQSITVVAPTTTSLKSESQVSEVKSEFKLIMKVNGEQMSYTLSKATDEIKRTKEFYEKHFFATKSLRDCIEVLMAINEANKMLISRWKLGENAIKMRSNLWITRKEEHKKTESKDSPQPNP